jgi:hypothetical protein
MGRLGENGLLFSNSEKAVIGAAHQVAQALSCEQRCHSDLAIQTIEPEDTLLGLELPRLEVT